MIGNDDRTNAREFSIGVSILTEAGTGVGQFAVDERLVGGDYIVKVAAL